MNDQVVVYGGGEHGRVVIEALQALQLPILGVVDEVIPNHLPVKYLGTWEKVSKLYPQAQWHVAIGDNTTRDALIKKVAQEVTQPLLTVIHPHAYVSLKESLSPGCFVAAGAVVAVGARLGPGCLINHGATVDHDCVLGRAVHIAPGVHLAGCVRVGDRSLVGVGSCAIPKVRIGSDAVVGAGSTVIQDVPNDTVVVGSPAKILPS